MLANRSPTIAPGAGISVTLTAEVIKRQITALKHFMLVYFNSGIMNPCVKGKLLPNCSYAGIPSVTCLYSNQRFIKLGSEWYSFKVFGIDIKVLKDCSSTKFSYYYLILLSYLYQKVCKAVIKIQLLHRGGHIQITI